MGSNEKRTSMAGNDWRVNQRSGCYRSRLATQRKKTYQEKAGRTWLGVAKDEWKNAVQGSA